MLLKFRIAFPTRIDATSYFPKAHTLAAEIKGLKINHTFLGDIERGVTWKQIAAEKI